MEYAYNATAVDDVNVPSNPQIHGGPKTGVGFPKLIIGDVQVVQCSGTCSFEFLIDRQESDSAVSLDELVVFTTSGTNRIDINTSVSAKDLPTVKTLVDELTPNYGDVELRYSLDSLDARNNVLQDNPILMEMACAVGSGELGIHLPVAAFTDFLGGGPPNPALQTDRRYVWMKFGAEGTLTKTSDGGSVKCGAASTCEEFAFVRDSAPLSSSIPEPSTGLATAMLLGGAWFWRMGSRRLARASKA